MNKPPQREPTHRPVLENELTLVETYIVTDEWVTDRVEGEPPDKASLAESIYTTAVSNSSTDLDEAEGGQGIQIIDLAGEDEGDEPLDFAVKIGQRDRERWKLDPASVDPDTRELSEEAGETKTQREVAAGRTRS